MAMIDPAGADLLLTTSPGREAEAADAPDPLPETVSDGAIWGDFAIGRLLGRGGMGAVYLARQTSMDRLVALKVLPAHLSGSEDFKRRFQLEAQVVGRISSPHVVQVHAAGIHDDHHFFAMEYVEGCDLASRLRHGDRPSVAESIGIAAQAARGLIAAAEHAVVHRDIKPGNLMISAKGVVKLMDFGLLTIAREDHTATVEGVVMGTVAYLSPEQARGERCDQRSDIYSLGVVLYELLTGRLPFTGEASVVIHHHIASAPTPPRAIDPTIPAHVEAVVLTCLAKRPADRYPSAAHLVSDLEALQADHAPVLAIALRRRTWPWRLAAIALATTVIAAGAIALRPVHGTASVVSPSIVHAPVPPPPVRIPSIAPEPIALAPVSAACGSAATVRAPFSGGDLRSFTWTIDGEHGSSGWLTARETVAAETTWNAPGRSASAIVRVVATDRSGRRHEGTVAAIATAPPAEAPRSLQVFSRRASTSLALTRLVADADAVEKSGWWAIRGDRLCHVTSEWVEDAQVPLAASEHAGALVSVRCARDELIILRERAFVVLSRDGTPKRALLEDVLAAATDAVVADDGTIFVSDREAGLFALASDGTVQRRQPHATGATRLCLLPDGTLAALVRDRGRIEFFTRDLVALPPWSLAAGDAIDLAPAEGGIAVLHADGSIRLMRGDAQGGDPVFASDSAIAGIPTALAVTASGSWMIAWPDQGLVSRVDSGGRSAGIRGLAYADAAWAADGNGRLIGFRQDRTLALIEPEGWDRGRLALATSEGVDAAMQFDARTIAVSPDGRSIAAIDRMRGSVVRFATDEPARAPLVIGARIGPGGTQSPGLALDEDARTYVLDADSGRIAVYDSTGAACFWFGGWGRDPGRFKGPVRFAVSPRGGVAYVVDDGRDELSKFLLDHGRRQASLASSEPVAGLAAIIGIGCDRQGLVYLAADHGDASRELRVLDWRAHRPETVFRASLASLGIASATAMGVSPDGNVYIAGGSAITGLRW